MAIKVVLFDIGNTLITERKWLPGAKEFIAELKNRQIRVGLISNTGKMDREELSGLLPKDFMFEDFEEGIVLLSSETGIEKPSLAIFSLAVQHASVSPWETMFVGESLAETLAAQSAGMRAVRIVHPARDYPELQDLLSR